MFDTLSRCLSCSRDDWRRASPCLAILAYPGCQLLDISGPWQVFATANDLSEDSLYTLHLVAAQPGPVVSNSGLALQADIAWHALATLAPLDTFLVAGGRGVMAQCQDTALLELLRQQARTVRRLGSICSGAFLLAAAGLLKGRQATTHWRHCQQLADDYPDIDVQGDALYLESEGIFSSAGVTAGSIYRYHCWKTITAANLPVRWPGNWSCS